MTHIETDDLLSLEVISDPEVRAMTMLERDIATLKKQDAKTGETIRPDQKKLETELYMNLRKFIGNGANQHYWEALPEPEDTNKPLMGNVFAAMRTVMRAEQHWLAGNGESQFQSEVANANSAMQKAASELGLSEVAAHNLEVELKGIAKAQLSTQALKR